MKKIKKILLLLLAFSFTTLLFNSQAYAVEYYTFEFNITDITDPQDVQYNPLDIFLQIKNFLVNNTTLGAIDPDVYRYINQDFELVYDILQEVIIIYDPTLDESLIYYVLLGNLEDSSQAFTVGSYTYITDVPITFTKTFWDQIIDVVVDIAVAFQAAASAGISLIYDGTALTSLGEIITITLGVGLVIGLFYLVIRVLPGARL